MSLTWWAAAAFGLEGQVRREIEALGFSAQAESGGVRFSGTAQDAFWQTCGCARQIVCCC